MNKQLFLSLTRFVVLLVAAAFFGYTAINTFVAIKGEVTWFTIFNSWPQLMAAVLSLAFAAVVQRRDSRIGRLMFS